MAYFSLPSSKTSHSIKSDSCKPNSLTILFGIVARNELDRVLALVNLVISLNEIICINYLYILHHSENKSYLIENYYLKFKRKGNVYKVGSFNNQIRKSTHYWEKNRRSGKGFEITQERIDVINTATEYYTR